MKRQAYMQQDKANIVLPSTDQEWSTFDAVLRPYIQNRVYTLRWCGAEKELAEDVLQETLLRAIHYVEHNVHEVNTPISSFEALCKTIAKRYLLDLRRKDKRLIVSIDTPTLSNSHLGILMSVDPAEIVLEDTIMCSIMQMIVKALGKFTPKQKEAMLIHLANLADFDDEHPRPLERVFWIAGVPLREYHRELPKNPVVRSRHTALVCLGYRQLRKVFAETYNL